MDTVSYNRSAWDKQVEKQNMWTIPVTSEQVQAARRGNWQIVLTPTKPVPAGWFPSPLTGHDVLCLASGGGQQGPILAAAGANVTVFDNSPRQLAQDRLVAERDGLILRTVQGDMADLSAFADGSFDLIINPVSTCFVEDVLPVWRECARVLRAGGALLMGFNQPHTYCLDEKDGLWFLRFALPYSDLGSLTPQERAARLGPDDPLEFSHTFTDFLAGQMAAGLALVDLYEDVFPDDPINKFMPQFMATRAVKLT
ncbi:methylase [Longilinea arvoryzae]|uniref:Methylase n=1 Tax=Longilinea arvoryzae TaxID=360412 RepID=A0A0S7BIB3_9CHLR|nr:class I SAM-dependent methyltransferase [Longilinea arvoryzae]GAP13338.1 methylase [Longilinea arvoryzae]